MEVIVLPVLQTSLNLPALIQACREMQQPNPATGPDEQGLQGFKHTIAVIDSIQRLPYRTGAILSLGYLIASWPEDMDLILAETENMTHLYHDGVERFQCSIVAGTIHQWMDACRRACVHESEYVVRFAFNRVYRDMEQRLPLGMLGHMRRTDNEDQTFLLEHK